MSQGPTFDSDDLGIYHYANNEVWYVVHDHTTMTRHGKRVVRTVPPLVSYHAGLDTLREALADISGHMPVHYPPTTLWTPDVEIQEAKNGHLYSGVKKGRVKGEKKMADGFLLLDGKGF